jgi:hypothetical protein
MEFSTLCGLIEGNREFRVKRGRRERKEEKNRAEHPESRSRRSVNSLLLCVLQVVSSAFGVASGEGAGESLSFVFQIAYRGLRSTGLSASLGVRYRDRIPTWARPTLAGPVGVVPPSQPREGS